MSSEQARERIATARERQARRLSAEGVTVNAHMDPRMLQRARAPRRSAGQDMLRAAGDGGLLSARGEHRLLRVARTIADLNGQRASARRRTSAPRLRCARTLASPAVARHELEPTSTNQPAGGACARCRRRSWLLGELSGPLDYCARDRTRLIELLALADEELLECARRADAHRSCEPATSALASSIRSGNLAMRRSAATIVAIPRALRGASAPHMLAIAGGAERLTRLTAAPVVAILGSRSASDYGMEMARSIARGLAASGVTVTAALTDGVAVAAHAGALDASGAKHRCAGRRT